jgi:hypothetical protein
MILLAGGVAVLDEHTRRARLETNASIIAALCTAVDRRILQIPNQLFFSALKTRFSASNVGIRAEKLKCQKDFLHV